jgi:hypothetical protein
MPGLPEAPRPWKATPWFDPEGSSTVRLKISSQRGLYRHLIPSRFFRVLQSVTVDSLGRIEFSQGGLRDCRGATKPSVAQNGGKS